MAKITCATCVWWQRSAPCRATALREPGTENFLGTCQVSTPTVVTGNGGVPLTVFPQTHQDRFCGYWSDRFEDGPGDGERVDNVHQLRPAA